MSNYKLHSIYSALDADKIDDAFNLISEIDSKKIEPKFINGYNSLKIRLLIRKNKFEEVLKYFETTPNLMSRDYIELVKYLNNISVEMSYQYFIDTILNKIKLKPKDIDKLIILKNIKILKSLVDQPVKTTFEGNQIIVNDINFNKLSIETIISNISVKIKNYLSIREVLKKIEYTQVIDGGNILYSSKGKLNDKSYKNLIKFYFSLEDPTLLILHKRHLPKMKKFINLYDNSNCFSSDKTKKKIKIFYTPYKCNDDIYILIASLIKQAKIITNDKYGDHNVNFSIDYNLRKYLDEKIISYTYNNSTYNLNRPKYSIVREDESKILIPSIHGGFVII